MEKDIPNIKEFFKEDNLATQPIYKSIKKYDVVYINPKLYKEIFNEEYDWDKAVNKISEMFSITLDKEKSNNELVSIAYVDKQLDPSGIALSGNLGSGRSYYYGEYFNIKGDKTVLATSPKTEYSNGRFPLSVALKETIISNILSNDFIIPSFETLAILDIKENYNFKNEYMDSNDSIKEEISNLPCAIEIRINKTKELYRVSNSFINNEIYTLKELKNYCEKLSQIEANKFCDRFLHGAWSVGNISANANLIDFDTAYFVKGRHPQYSNTNKYKSNYFGNELLGQKNIVNIILDNASDLIDNKNETLIELENLMNNKYEEELVIRFCDLLGLDYKLHYSKYSSTINDLCKKFNTLSRKFLPNYYDLNVLEENCSKTNIFDFSKLFQKYLILKSKNGPDILTGLKLLFNNTTNISYKKVGIIKEKIDSFFGYDIVKNIEQESSIMLKDAIDFINEYDGLFTQISDGNDLSLIKMKAYIINENRKYLNGDMNIYGELTKLYRNGKIDTPTLNKIINALINTNKRNYIYDNQNEFPVGLMIYKDCLTYFIISSKYYYFVIEPFSELKIDFAKITIDGGEFMVRHNYNENGHTLVSEKINFDNIPDILSSHVKIKINGKSHQKERLLIQDDVP